MMRSEGSPRDSERRQATVIFADISGFTAMSERMDPEEITLLMNECFALLEAAVRNHGGSVDKYIGDCIMALFGVPDALENAAKRAVNAAIDMRNRLREFSSGRGLAHLDLHVGINSGLVLAGHVGGEIKRDFTVMGDAVNVASRLKDAAEAGAIFVGPQTYQATKGEFEYRALRPLALKGKEQRLEAYELLSVEQRLHRTKMIASAMVGRAAELETMAASIRATLAGEGRTLAIVGEAGIGKSRLTAEVAALEEIGRLTVLEARSLAIGQSLSFHPFDDLLRRWAGIEDDDDEPQAFGRLESAVRGLFADQAGEILPFVATLMGMRLTGDHAERLRDIAGEAMETLIFKSMRELLITMAAEQPLMLVFEDLHWADLSSIKLLESLLRLIEESRILFVFVCRPDYPDTAQRLLQVCRERYAGRHVEIVLERLDDAESEALVQNLLELEELPRSARAMICGKTEGNPFYIEEVVRSLIDQAIVETTKDGRLRLTDKIDSAVVPDTVQEVIMTRVDRLEPSTRRVLQVGSVIGRSFYHRVLAAVMDGTTTLDAELTTLKERQLLLERRTRRTATLRRQTLADEVEYVFTHALVQETIYESILQRTRKELHLRVAQAIESQFAERLVDFYGMLAYHYGRAERLEKAEEYLFKAGDEAARSAASPEALGFFREASRLYLLIHGEGGDRRKKALLEKNIGMALLGNGSLAESIAHFDGALTYLGDRPAPGVLGKRGRFALDFGAFLWRLAVGARGRRAAGEDEHEALEIRENRARAQTTSDPEALFFDTVGTLRRLQRLDPTTVDHACGMYAGAAALFSFAGLPFALSRRTLAIAHDLIRPGNQRDRFVYRSMVFFHHYLEGDWSEDLVIDDRAVEAHLRCGQVWDVGFYLDLDCERKLHRGEFAAARRQIEKIAELDRVYGYGFAKSTEVGLTALLLLEQRDLAAAQRAEQQYHAARHEVLLNLIALGNTARIQLLMGERAEALATLAKAEVLIAEAGTIPPFHRSAALMARFLADVTALEDAQVAGDVAAVRELRTCAVRSQRAALRIAAKVARERTEVYRLTGRLAWLLGKHERALTWWRKSLRVGEALGARPELGRTYLEIGRRLATPGPGPRRLDDLDAEAALARARELFTVLGLGWDLDRLIEVESPGRATPGDAGTPAFRARPG